MSRAFPQQIGPKSSTRRRASGLPGLFLVGLGWESRRGAGEIGLVLRYSHAQEDQEQERDGRRSLQEGDVIVTCDFGAQGPVMDGFRSFSSK